MNAIEVLDVKKRFRVYGDKAYTLKERILFRRHSACEHIQVLDGVSFSVKRGEAMGLVGQNGSGKSTMLKLLTRIIYPDEGSIRIRGRVSSLLELGAGFHPDMSGRENIYINAPIFGLNQAEIESRMDDIIRFSELEGFIDAPVRTYSSGMYMRLAFSIAINVDADILLIDEILAVGDADFQEKCFHKLREIKAKGVTIVIVSHVLSQIEQFCDRSIWINRGKICAEGKPYDVHVEYLRYMGVLKYHEPETAPAAAEEREAAPAAIGDMATVNGDGNLQSLFAPGEAMSFLVRYEAKSPIARAAISLSIFREDGVLIWGGNSAAEGRGPHALSASGTATIRIPAIPLLPGKYWVDVLILRDGNIPVDRREKAHLFEVYGSTEDEGMIGLKCHWRFD